MQQNDIRHSLSLLENKSFFLNVEKQPLGHFNAATPTYNMGIMYRGGTLFMVFSVTYYLKLHIAITFHYQCKNLSSTNVNVI